MTRALSLSFAALFSLLAAPAAAQTTVPPGNLVGGSQTWTVAGSPYVLSGDVTVQSGLTLTIQAGVEVRMGPGDSQGSGSDTSRTELRVAGRLVVQGNTSSRVTFTSGAGTRATGDYYGVVVLSGGTASIEGATFEYGDHCLYDQSVGGVITDLVVNRCGYGYTVDGGSPTVTGGSLTNSSNYGLYVLGNAIVTASGLTVASNGSYGVYATDANLTLTGSVIRNNSSRGVYLRTTTGSHTMTLTHDTIYGNSSYGIHVYQSSGTLNATIRDDLILSNGSYGVYISGSPNLTVSYNLVFDHSTDLYGVSGGSGYLNENPLVVNANTSDFHPTSRSPLRQNASDSGDIGAVAYNGTPTPSLTGHLYTNTVLTAADSPHMVTGDLTVRAGVTLTIEPGATLQFATSDQMRAGIDTNHAELRVLGTLIADGTASQGITFRSAGASPAAGDWYGIYLAPGSQSSIIDYANIRNARYGVHSSASSGTVIQRSTIEGSANYGVYGEGGAAVFSELVVRNNGSYGVYFTDSSSSLASSRIYDNSSRGIYVRSTTGSNTVSLTSNTIAGNSSYGIHLYQSSGTLNVTIRNCLITANGSYGIYISGSPNVTTSNNLVWGHTTDLYGISIGTGGVTENPLLVDLPGRDLRITSASPARRHSSTGGDIGALAYDGAQTVGVQGHLYEDTTWAPTAGPISVLGDVTIEPGVTLTISPGTQVRFAAGSDSMGGNVDTSSTELIALGRLVVDGDPQSAVTLGSAATTPARGNWYGVRLLPSAASSTIDHAIIEYARYGIDSSAPSSAVVSTTELRQNANYGAYIQGGAITLDGLVIHDNGSYGVYSTDASPALNNLVVYSNSSRGLYLRSTTGSNTVTVNHLTAWGNTSYGLHVYQSSGTLNVTLRNSIISENGSYGIYISGSPNMTLANNDVWGHTTDYYGVSAGGASISSNPRYVNTALGNFHLLPNSPAIDVAAAATSLNHDAEGQTRPIDGDLNAVALPDMGAYEYNPSSNRWPLADAGPDQIVTSGVPATFSGAGSVDPDGSIASYVWDFGDGSATASGVTVTHTFTGGTDRVVTLTVTDNSGAIAVDTVNVIVNLPPLADAGPDKYADPGEVVTFAGTGSSDSDGSIARYAWTFGDGTSASGATVTHQYATGGNYTVTLTVTDNQGATASDTATAHITGAPPTPPTVTHTPIADGRTAGQAQTVQATITGSPAIASATLYYRTRGASTFVAAAMTTSGGGVYTAQIPAGAVVSPAVEYYLEAVDTAVPPRTATSPASAGTVYAFTVITPDTMGPAIVHTAIGDGQPPSVAVVISAAITDASGVASASLYYRAHGSGGFTQASMTTSGGSTYSATIPAAAVTTAGVDYYLSAADGASPANTSAEPMGAPGAFHTFTVTLVDTSGPTIVHTPIANGQTPATAIPVTASVTDPSGVASVTLGYRVHATGSFTTVAMTTPGGGSYSATIPAASVTTAGVDYYISAIDGASPANTGTSPTGAPANSYFFTVVLVDTTPPTIVHTPVADGQTPATAIPISANVTDGSGVASVTLFYRVHGVGAFGQSVMTSAGGSTYSGSIPAASVTTAGVDYYIQAADIATPANTATSPSGAPSSFDTFTVVAPVTVAPGDLVITEIMFDPSGSETQREWFEVYNTTNSAIDLNGFTFADTGVDSFTLSRASAVLVAPGHYFVLGRSADQSVNGGVAVDYAYTGFALSNTADEIVMSIGGVEIDRVAYGAPGGFPHTAGHSIGLDPDQTDYTSNNDGSAWCNSTSMIADGDFGTPGARNDSCQAPADTTPPAIVHTPVTNGQQAGVGVAITAQVTDTSGVASVELYYRVRGQGSYTSVAMGALGGTSYQAEIPAGSVTVMGVEYYLRALDRATTPNEALDPASGAAAPHAFDVTASDTSGPSINHTPVAGDRPAGVTVPVSATITDPSGVGHATLYYRPSGGSWASMEMASLTGGGYQATIPANVVAVPEVAYYLEASDGLGNTSKLPAGGDGAPFTFSVVTVDATGPTIVHTPVADGQTAGASVAIQAKVTDASGVGEVALYYRAAGTVAFESIAMTAGANDQYNAEIPGSIVVAGGVDYYIEASDLSAAQNVSRDPAGAPAQVHAFSVRSEPGDETGPTILHIPVAADQVAGSAVAIVAEVVDPSGIASVTLSYRVAGHTDFVDVEMAHDSNSDQYRAEIPAEAITTDGVEYWLAATDGSARANRATKPATAPAELYTFTVVPRSPIESSGRPEGGCACGVAGGSVRGGGLGALLALGLLLATRSRRRR